MRRILRENGLSIVMFSLFAFAVVGQSITGYHDYNDDLKQHGQAQLAFVEYLGSGHFVEAIFENWESEFLQMGLYVLLTAFLYQKGSPESKKLDEKELVDSDPLKSRRKKANAPWPVRRGGFILRIYKHSLISHCSCSFLFPSLFMQPGGARLYSKEQAMHGLPSVYHY